MKSSRVGTAHHLIVCVRFASYPTAIRNRGSLNFCQKLLNAVFSLQLLPTFYNLRNCDNGDCVASEDLTIRDRP